ncbi:LpxI family protein [Aliiroseovarius sp. YM-037]|uniref:LpxI family protein n=1 Tax=Aliiroseovarius sp. YM-037 TaxID=3341728 RepID=UPI003A80E400
MLALIAGQGRLPVAIADRLEAEGTPFHLCEMEGFPVENCGGRPIIRFRIEQVGSFLEKLTGLGVNDVVFAGTVHRPPIDPSQIDSKTLPLVPRMLAAIKAGDDAALRGVLSIFEDAGFAIKAAHEVLPELLPAAGVLSDAQPDETAQSDAARGAEIVAAMGAVDVGQACVVSRGQALAIEALPGTDWMLQTLSDGGGGPQRPEGGILFKAPKPMQDRRVDLPAIGPETVRGAKAAGLSGIVIEAGGVMVLDRDATIAEANALGLFLWVRESA